MRTSGSVVGIAAVILFVSFLLPENRPSVPAPAYSIAADRGGEAESRLSPAPLSTRPAGDRLARAISSESRAEAQTREKLSQIVPEVVFPEGSTIEDVIEFMRNQGKLSIDVNWNALSLVGLDRTATLTLNLHHARIQTALKLALENVGAASGVQLGYQILDGIIRISTKEELDRDTVTRVYDCKDLVREGLSEAEVQRIMAIFADHLGTVPPGNVGDLLRAELGFSGQTELLDLIRSHVRPDTWETSRGSINSISIYDGLLVITHSPGAHEKVGELLSMMRDVKVARGAAQAPEVHGAMMPGMPMGL
jgi:hypothetical protein